MISESSKSPQSLAEAVDFDFLGGSKSNKIQTEIKILESPSVLLPVFEYAKKLKGKNGYDTSKMFFSRWKKDSFALEVARNTKVLNVAYKDKIKK